MPGKGTSCSFFQCYEIRSAVCALESSASSTKARGVHYSLWEILMISFIWLKERAGDKGELLVSPYFGGLSLKEPPVPRELFEVSEDSRFWLGSSFSSS